MAPIPLGKITVAAAGTPTPITAALIAAAITANGYGQLAPGGTVGMCHKIEVWADTAATAAAYVMVKSGSGWLRIASLPAPANGHCEHWHARAAVGANLIDPTLFAIDVATSGQGAYATLWVD
jgi:hypothetical protein